MKVYCEYYHNSTGYIERSIPPKFDKAHIKPIPMCGNDGVFILDGRLSFEHMKNLCLIRMQMVTGAIGFKIIKANSFLDKGTVLYSFKV